MPISTPSPLVPVHYLTTRGMLSQILGKLTCICWVRSGASQPSRRPRTFAMARDCILSPHAKAKISEDISIE
jgi:hypothetical protein